MTDFSVNVQALFGHKKEFTRIFKQQINAEQYIREIDSQEQYRVLEYNFVKKFSDQELDAYKQVITAKIAEANRLEKECLERTVNNFKDPEKFPCEVCGKAHSNYKCCSACNYNKHTCHFCGDTLGHSEVSSCYIMAEWDD